MIKYRHNGNINGVTITIIFIITIIIDIINIIRIYLALSTIKLWKVITSFSPNRVHSFSFGLSFFRVFRDMYRHTLYYIYICQETTDRIQN